MASTIGDVVPAALAPTIAAVGVAAARLRPAPQSRPADRRVGSRRPVQEEVRDIRQRLGGVARQAELGQALNRIAYLEAGVRT
ncbi:MAG: hypothetical protein R2695_04190 [Acidimicrobiales bacterium]